MNKIMIYYIVHGKKYLTNCAPLKWSYTETNKVLFKSHAQANVFCKYIRKGKWPGLYKKRLEVKRL